jgi:hypothetical protein
MSQHGNIMNPNTGDYMDAQGPPQGEGGLHDADSATVRCPATL